MDNLKNALNAAWNSLINPPKYSMLILFICTLPYLCYTLIELFRH